VCVFVCLCVCVCVRFLYWGQSGGENAQGIYRCSLDGSGRRRIVDLDIVHPTGLALGQLVNTIRHTLS